MSKSLEQIMADMAAQGITISTTLATGVPVTDRAATRIRDAARAAGIAYGEPEESK